jgi:hypothetical protein
VRAHQPVHALDRGEAGIDAVVALDLDESPEERPAPSH